MAFFSTRHTKISGISAAVPLQKDHNKDYDYISEKERKLLIKTTGVETRHITSPGMTTSDLCYAAAEKLLDELQWKRGEIDVLIFLSQSRDYYLPATGIILQDRLGLKETTMAFDISLGCSGFPYGLSVINQLLSNSSLKKGLLMMGDVSSLTCNNKDKSTFPLFGDAGTVIAVEHCKNKQTTNFQLQSDGSHHKTIMIPDGGVRNLLSKASFDITTIEKGINRNRLNVVLNGLDVFNFSVTKVPKSIKDFLEKTNTTPPDYDYFLMHQANKLMNETIRKKLKFSEAQVPYSIKDYGNTSSASIPLTLVTQLREEAQTQKLALLASGFGVGLSWGSVSFTTDKICVPELVEL